MSYITSSALLGNAGVFTSEERMCNRDDTIVGAALSAQGGSIAIQQGYPDDVTRVVTWSVTDTIAVSAATGTKFNVACVCPKWRVVYTNGATPQTTFRFDAKTTAAGDS